MSRFGQFFSQRTGPILSLKYTVLLTFVIFCYKVDKINKTVTSNVIYHCQILTELKRICFSDRVCCSCRLEQSEAPAQQDPLERANLNHYTRTVSSLEDANTSSGFSLECWVTGQVQQPSNSGVRYCL